MKRETIENLLKDAGVTDDKLKGVIDSILAENGNDIEKLKASKASVDEQLKAANKTLEKFKDVDVDGLKGEVQRYKEEAEAKDKANKAELEKS